MRTAVDLYCGSGGVTQGLRAAGWDVIAACDFDEVASRTYKVNHPAVSFVKGDIWCNKTIDAIEVAVDGRSVDMLVICAPCQPFSSQNRHRGGDTRESLIVRALVVAERINPQMVFFENVPGLATPTYRFILEDLRDRLHELGFQISVPMVRDAACYGVPQRRRRCIMLAARDVKAIEAFSGMNMTAERKTVFDAIADLPPLVSGEADPHDKMHRARNHQPIALERLKYIPKDGGSRRSLPAHLELKCHRGKNAFPDVYGRMSWNSVAPTLTTGCCDVTRGRYAHPEQDRAITLREAARLQTFPDHYMFFGNSSQVATQIGNAVPPNMITSFVPAFEAALATSEV